MFMFKKRLVKNLGIGLLMFLGSSMAGAQSSRDLSPELMRWIESLKRITAPNEGTTVCTKDIPLAKLEVAINDHVRTLGGAVPVVSEPEMLQGLIKRYPCPFDPRDVPVREVSASELEGGWVLAVGSQQFKTNRFKEDPFGNTDCQAFGFFKSGRMGYIEQRGRGTCLPVRVADLSGAISSGLEWRSVNSGELTIRRISQNVEEVWAAYRVESDFIHKGIKFASGDLLLYLRNFGPVSSQGRGTLYFRHFQPSER
jgi:hypothetical protein